MHSSASKDPGQIPNVGNPLAAQAPPLPPKPVGGLKRMQGSARLLPKIDSMTEEPRSERLSHLNHSSSMAILPFSQSSSSSIPDSSKNFVSKPMSNLTRTKTSIGPLIYKYPERESNESEATKRIKPSSNDKDGKTASPVMKQVQRASGGTFMSAFILPSDGLTRQEMPVVYSNDVTAPPVLRRSSSGSMLLRQAPKKKKQFDELSPPNFSQKNMRRSGSLLQLAPEEKHLEEPTRTPLLKRQRTSSITSNLPPDSMPVLTPQTRLRPRTSSESRTEELKSPVKKPMASPMKKRTRYDSGSAPPSPLKKRYTSTATIRLGGGGEDEPATLTATPQSSLRRNKSTAAVRTLLSERIAQTYGTERKQNKLTEIPETMGQSSSKREQPKLTMRSTSGDSYYTANEEDEQAPSSSSVPIENSAKEEEVPKGDVFVTPRNSLQEEEMVPLVKKQMSIDEKIMEDEEDEGFGDSTKTIKKGQGAALARSLSLKLSPRKDQQKPIGADTEKSCSTPSLPTAPLLRQGSASTLRFKVSPSTFLKPFNVSPVVSSPPVPASPVVPIVAFPTSPSDLLTPTQKVSVEELSEPSTSTTMSKEWTPELAKTKKSALRKPVTQFVVRDDYLVPASRRRSVQYEGLKVYYFGRKQGDTTVPSEGEVSLGMHDKHHSQRYFPLSSGKRPKLDLDLYSDEDLSDGEVITPDDDEHEYEEYSSARTIAHINEKTRMRLLKKSGIQADKSGGTAKTLRDIRNKCGCSCENGICLPETCQCAIDGIQCQVDTSDIPTHPCVCSIDKCENPNGRIFYDPDAVRDHRTRAIMNWKAGQKTGFSGSPTIKKFVDSDDEDQNAKNKSWLLKSAIPLKLEESPQKYPVTPVYTRRSRSSLSDIRESTSESNFLPAPSTSLAERMKLAQHLENETCVEDEEKEEDTEKDDTVSLQEVYVEPNTDPIIENELETTMSPVKATMVA